MARGTTAPAGAKQGRAAGRGSPIVTAEERLHMIADAAVFRAARRQLSGQRPVDEKQCWREAEAEIDAVLERHRVGR